LPISKALMKLMSLINNDRANLSCKVFVPYGKHSYGPQPKIIGFMPWVLLKARGSKVGNFCSIAQGLRFIFLGKHNAEWVSTYPFDAFYEKWKVNTLWHQNGVIDSSRIKPNPIIIENDVWIENNAAIKEGVRIGSGAIVAMESLVTTDVPPYAIVGGNPARIIKYRFSKEQIRDMLEIEWWNWDDTEITKLVPLMLSENIEEFINIAKKKV
jgi:acetyltransferase-like isoleucine patch superfamily enzyme